MATVICILIIPAVFFAELRIKNRVERYITINGKEGGKSLLGGRLLLRRYHNRGAMLGLGRGRGQVVTALAVMMTALTLPAFVLSLGRRGNVLLRVGLALLLGGAFSNTYDRLRRKYVVDYLSFGVRWEHLRSIVFNISDFCIILGALLATLGVPDKTAWEQGPGGTL